MTKLTKKDDLVIGAVTNCDFGAVRLWCNSLDRSGFNGTKAVVMYGSNPTLRSMLKARGFEVLDGGDLTRLIVVQRFKDIPELVLSQLGDKFRNIIATDMFDVVFQSDPSNWLTENLTDKDINVGSECIRYKDEDWGRGNLRDSFGSEVYEQHADNIIYNAGTVAGKFEPALELFCDIFRMSLIAETQNPDQAALNVLIHTDKWKDRTNFATMESAWACQAGTVAHPGIVDKYRPFLTEKEPIFEEDECFTSSCQMFTLVHQYNRVPAWKSVYDRVYGD